MKIWLISGALVLLTSCLHQKASSDVLNQVRESPVGDRAIYDALSIDAVPINDSLPGSSPSFRKTVGRLSCSLALVPEAVYSCSLAPEDGQDRLIFHALDVQQRGPDLPGNATWTKQVGRLSCLHDGNIGSNFYRCQLASNRQDPDEEDQNQPIRLSGSRLIYEALQVEPEASQDGLPGSTGTLQKRVGRLFCTNFFAPEAGYSCLLHPRHGSDESIYQVLDVEAVASNLPGAASETKRVGGLSCTAAFEANPNGTYYCAAINSN